MDPALRTAGVVFGGVGLVPCPGWIDTPFVGESGRAPNIVLIKREELPILQDGKVLVVDSVQLFGEKKKEKKKRKVSNLFGKGDEPRQPLTGVPMSSGDFSADQIPKWVLVSSAVRLPFPTSSMSRSLWPKKSLYSRKKTPWLIIGTLSSQYGQHISPKGAPGRGGGNPMTY